jgi:Lon-like protease
VAAAVLLVGAAWIRVPYYSVGPGPVRAVLPMIRFEGPPRYDPSGQLAMTTVRTKHLTPLTAIGAWLDPNEIVVRESVLYPSDYDREREDRRAISQMDGSKIDATVVVLSRLADYPDEHGAGALIEATVPGCPADGELFPGDVVVRIDGRPIEQVDDASTAIEAAPRGHRMRWLLDVDGAREEATFARARCVEGSGPLVGVRMLDTFPFPVTISSGDVGGPSAGLMFALGLWELMTPSDLTAGRLIAGTGTIDLDGNVGPIGGIADKIAGAEREGAELFLVPVENFSEVRNLDTGDMRLVPVATFDDALEALRAGEHGP